jgi:hypothetical protein
MKKVGDLSTEARLVAELDTGNVKTISGQFKKGDLCTKYGLNVRDKRLPDCVLRL